MSKEQITITFLCENNPPISVPFQKFIVHSDTEKIEKSADYKDKYAYDSILQFSKACIDEEPKITPENVFGYYSLCGEWEVDSSVKKYADDFLKENGQKLLINHLQFQLDHEQDPSQQKEELKLNLPNYINEPNLSNLQFDVLKEVVDFKVVENDQESFQKVYSFCLNYFDEHPDNKDCSELFQTLDTSKLSYEDLAKLVGKPLFDRTKLNDSLGTALAELNKRTDEMPKLVDEIQEKYHQDLEEMKAREEAFKKDQEESKLLREELQEEKEKVIELTKKMDEIRDSMFPFLKETKQLHDDFLKEKEEREKKEKEERKLKEAEDQKVAVPVCYPDWSNPSDTSWSNSNASDDGWMCVQCGCSSSSPCYVTVAGKRTFLISGINSGYTYSSVLFPIKTGQSLNYNTSSTTSRNSYFMKFKQGKIVTLPDWKNAILKKWYQSYSADCDGWIYADCGSNGNNGYIQMCGSINVYICYHPNGYQSYSSVLIPVSSGEQYTANHGGYPGVCYFIPGKKDYQVGMPDWEKEQNQSWGTQYEAAEKGWVYAQCRSYSCTNCSSGYDPGYLMLCGIPILISQNNAGYYDNASVFIPVDKGDKYNAIGGNASQSISFFPLLK